MRILGFYRLLLLVSLGLCCHSNYACAEKVAVPEGRATSCDEDAECSRYADDGYEHLQAGRLEKARRAYEAAYTRRADPKLLYNLGRVLHKSGRAAEAADYYRRYLDAGAEGNEEQRRKSQQYLQQATKEAASQPAVPLARRSRVGAVELPADLSAPASPTPVYKKWWLWTIVGGAAGIALGVGLGVGLAARRPDLTDAGIARPFN
jgi:tetratricopeptide (TPR) repeat protein